MKNRFLQIILSLTFLFAFTFTILAYAEQSPSPSIVVHLLDYLAKDYGGAVRDGKVLSKSEYAEQIEFAEIVSRTTREVPSLQKSAEFSKGVSELLNLIKGKKSAESVSALARKLQQNAIQLSGIEIAPRTWPNLAQGTKLYQENCVACHGNTGMGDGPAGATLEPKPANFHDPELVWNSSPYKFYNTIRLGVPGTGMASFAALSDEQVWAIAFYLKSIPYSNRKNFDSKSSVTLKDAASLTDAELAERITGDKNAKQAIVGSIRTTDNTNMKEDPLLIAETLLEESSNQAKAGNYDQANTLSLQAYLQGFEPVEPKLKANLPGFVEQVETLMAKYRTAIGEHQPHVAIASIKDDILGKIKEARAVFSTAKMSPEVAFGAAFSIFLREGFEAVLIIIVLISILRAMGQQEAARWVHIGWLSAVALGIAAWFASGLIVSLSGLSRELLEGVISILAVVVLIYVGFWLHRYSEIKRWRAFLEAKLKEGLTKGSYLALALVAFMAVFREAFEVVLFLRAIWIDLESSSQNIAGMGVLSSFILLIGLSWFAVKESRKLPLGILFQICSWTMVVLAFILAGKGIHSLQEAGILSVSSIPFPIRFDLLGVYPSIQTFIVQIGVILLFGLLLFNEKRSSLAMEKSVE